MRKIVALAVIAALSLGGWWFYARWQMQQKVVDLRNRIENEVVVARRGMEPMPSEDRLRTEIDELAENMGAEVTNLVISRETVGGASRPTKLDGASARLQKALNQVGVRPRRESPQVIDHRVPEVVATRYEVRATVEVKSGLWSHTEQVSIARVLGRRVEM